MGERDFFREARVVTLLIHIYRHVNSSFCPLFIQETLSSFSKNFRNPCRCIDVLDWSSDYFSNDGWCLHICRTNA